MSDLIHLFTPYAQQHVSEMHDTDLTYLQYSKHAMLDIKLSNIALEESSAYWSGSIHAINEVRARAVRVMGWLLHSLVHPLFNPAYPFQYICADFFHHKGANYLFVVDRYSN